MKNIELVAGFENYKSVIHTDIIYHEKDKTKYNNNINTYLRFINYKHYGLYLEKRNINFKTFHVKHHE